MHPPAPVVLQGRAVRLEPLGAAHADDLLAAGRAEAVWRWLPAPPPASRAEVLAMVAAADADPARLAFAVVVDGRAVGSTSYLDVDLAVGGLEIGWTWYAQAVWGSAVNPECKLLLLAHAFEALGAERVTLKTDRANARSRAAILRLGAQHDGVLRHHRRRPDGTVRDTAYYSVLAAEWPDVRRGLERRLDGPGLSPPGSAGAPAP